MVSGRCADIRLLRRAKANRGARYTNIRARVQERAYGGLLGMIFGATSDDLGLWKRVNGVGEFDMSKRNGTSRGSTNKLRY